MTETPTEDAAAKNRSGGVHLPVLPDGWHYTVQMVGPGSLGVEVAPTEALRGVFGPKHKLRIHTGRQDVRHVEVDSLSEAVRTGIQTVRTLRDLTAAEAKATQAREKLLAGIGQPSPQNEDGTLATPDSLGEKAGAGTVAGLSDGSVRRRPPAGPADAD